MEEKDLLRTETDENQSFNATTESSEEAQVHVSQPTLEMSSEEEKTTKNSDEVPTPVAEEETQAPENEKNNVTEMMAEIETAQSTEEETDENSEPETESREDIEAEYAAITVEEAADIFATIVAEPDYNKIKTRVGILRTKILDHIKEVTKAERDAFIEAGGNKDEFVHTPTPIEEKFNQAYKIFKNNKAKFLENIELEKKNNLNAKNTILEELRKLIEDKESHTHLKELNDRFKDLQERWKNIGTVPQNEANTLWQNYHFYIEQFYDILRLNREMKDLDLKKNLEQKIKLCEAAESLILQESINQSFNELQTLHNEWKEIGPVPEDKKEELWERFKTASDQINQRRREHYDKIFAEQQNNYNAKVVLCEKAEEIIAQPTENAKEYNTISDQLTELLKVWKTLGAAPPKVNEEIWNRFKGSLDKFFEKKKEFFQKIKEEQQNNYNLKMNLAIQAEAIAKRTDWRAATDEILALQQEWKNIGSTARKHSEALWKRFRSACDTFFEAKANYFSNIQEIEGENLRKKEELIQRILDHQFGDNKNENLEAIKSYQREWTEIGFVPKNDKDRIYTAYRQAVDKRFNDLKVSMEELRRDNYRNRIDTILNDPNSDKLLDKEKRFLNNKLNQLKEDIAIWENNLGFFANSKNADLLKAEFSKKIEAAKAEVKNLEYKIKMMNKPKETTNE